MSAVLSAVLITTVGVWGQGAGEPQGSEGIAQIPLSDASAAQGQEQNNERGSGNFALPVRVVDDPEESQNAREHQHRTEQHDAKDLLAQQLAADAASRSAAEASIQTGLIRLQTYTVIFGTAVALGGAIMLWFTLRWTRRTAEAGIRSADAAHAAVAHAQDTSRRQLRAYITFQHCDVVLRGAHAPSAEITLINRGATPAWLCDHETQWFFACGERILENKAFIKIDEMRGPSDVVTERTIVRFTIDEMDAIAQENGGRGILYLFGLLGYFDIYDRPYKIRYVSEYNFSRVSPAAGRMGVGSQTSAKIAEMRRLSDRRGTYDVGDQ